MTDNRYEQLTQGQTVLANYKTDKDLIQKAGDKVMYIGRANPRCGLPKSPWHNPFKVTQETSRTEAILKYADYLLQKPELFSRLEELRGKLLVCWCYPEPCHGNILIEFLQRQKAEKDYET